MAFESILNGLLTAVVGAIVGTFMTVYFTKRHDKRKGRKRISFQVVKYRSLFASNAPTERNAIDISYDGQQVRDPVFVDLLMVNDGEQPIARSEYDGPITVSLRSYCRVLKASMDGKTDWDGRFEIHHGTLNDSILISDLMLNPGARHTIELVCDGALSNLELSASIYALSDIREINKPDAYYVSPYSAAIPVLLLGAALIAVLSLIYPWYIYVSFVLLFCGALCFLLYRFTKKEQDYNGRT